jgi:hypothetical protein
MKQVIILLSIILTLSLVSAQFIYDNPTLPKLNPGVNTTSNTSIIDASNVKKTTGTYFLGQFLDSIIDQLYVMISSSTNITFINDTYVPYTGAGKNVDLGSKNLTAQSIYVPEDGRVSLSKNLSNAYIFYNSTNQRLEMWVNGKIQQDWGNSTTIYGKATFQSDAFFQNLSGVGLLINTNVIVDGNLSSTNVYSGNLCYNDGTNCTYFNSTFTNLTALINLINQSLSGQIANINSSLTNLSKVNTYFAYNNITTSGGVGGGNSSKLNFIITRITVTPSNLATSYKYKAVLLSDNTVIDQDRIPHHGIWDIYKTASVSNDILISNITNASPDDTFTIKVTYSNNFQ